MALGNAVVMQGNVDIAGSNTPIISYNSTPFITPPTGLTAHKLYQQYAPGMVHSVMDFGIPLYAYEFNGFASDVLDGMTLAAGGTGALWGFYAGGLFFIPTEAGLAGDFKPLDTNRAFSIGDLGPGSITQFVLGGGYNADHFNIVFSGPGLGPRFTLFHFSTSNNDDDQGQFNFGKSHDAAYALGTTVDGEKLGIFRFKGINAAADAQTTYDARIRSVQNGAAAADGIPVDLFLEASDGTAWNIGQLKLRADGGIETQTMKSGATQVAAGAVVGEHWYTVGHASLPDGVQMIGI